LDKSKQTFVLHKLTDTRHTARDRPKKCPVYVARYSLQQITSSEVSRVYQSEGLVTQ